MLKIVHIIESLSIFGGTPRKLLYLLNNCDNNFIENMFITYQKSPNLSPFLEKGAHVEYIREKLSLKLLAGILNILKKYDASVICTHFTRPLLIGFFSAKIITNKPWIHNEHSSAYYRKGLGLTLSKFCLPKADLIICNSYHTANSIQQVYSIDSSKLLVIHNPVEKREVTQNRLSVRNQLGITDNDILIGHVGGMIESRDQKTLIQAFAAIKIVQPNVRLILIGEGPVLSNLKELTDTLDVNESVIFIGYTDNIGNYLEAMDIYVNPTLDEGFGIAVVEAMLARLPVVLSNCGAHPELIIDGESGLLYEGLNTKVLSDTLCKLINDPNLRLSLSENASNRAQQLFSPQRYASEYISAVESVVYK